MLITTSPQLCEWLHEGFKEAQVQSTSKVERHKWYCDKKANAISLEPGDLVLTKVDTYRGRRKVKDWWKKDLYQVEHQIAEGVPSYLWRTSRQDTHESSTETDFSHHSYRGDSSLYDHAC